MTSKIYPGNKRLALDHLAVAHRFEEQGDLKAARGHRERARELDPSVSPRMTADSIPNAMALDAATENAIIKRAIRTARRQSAATRKSRKVTSMTRPSSNFDADALLQRDPDSRDRGPDFSRAWASRNQRRVSPRSHALDAEPDHETALKQLEYAQNHVSAVRAGSADFDRERFTGYLRNALEAMQSGAEDGDDPETEYNSEGMEIRGNARAGGEDDIGETPARAVVRSGSRELDHRKDFNSIKQGGADSALTEFNADSLFQRK